MKVDSVFGRARTGSGRNCNRGVAGRSSGRAVTRSRLMCGRPLRKGHTRENQQHQGRTALRDLSRRCALGRHRHRRAGAGHLLPRGGKRTGSHHHRHRLAHQPARPHRRQPGLGAHRRPDAADQQARRRGNPAPDAAGGLGPGLEQQQRQRRHRHRQPAQPGRQPHPGPRRWQALRALRRARRGRSQHDPLGPDRTGPGADRRRFGGLRV